mgnify:FL=1
MSGQASGITLDLDGELVQAEVVRSPRVRVARIQIGAQRPLRIIVPADTSDEDAADALRSKRSWIRDKLRLIERQETPRLGLDRPGVVWINGAAMQVIEGDVRFAREQDGVLVVPAGEQAAEAVLRWYRRRARKYLRELVATEAKRLGCTVRRLAVRDQRTRWGSCAPTGTISLNWRLVIPPRPVARYVVVHELIHLSIPNHSKAFWRALSAALPDWEQAATWLSDHGHELRSYAPGACALT